jgi:hypothetical protein
MSVTEIHTYFAEIKDKKRFPSEPSKHACPYSLTRLYNVISTVIGIP